MEEKDLQQLEAMMTRVVDRYRRETVAAFDQRIGIAEEHFQHKLEVVVEGQQMLGERMGRLENRMDKIETGMERVELKMIGLEKKVDNLEKKVDGIAADLTAHRADTEAHRRGWRVREE